MKTDTIDLPTNWHWEPLKKVLQIRSGSVDPRNHPTEMFDLLSIPAHDAGMEPEVTMGRNIGSSKKIVKPDDCLLSRLNPRIPRVWVVGPGTGRRQISSTEFLPLVDRSRPNGERWFEPYFLRYMLLSPSFRNQVAHQVMGATGSRQRLKREDINAAMLPIPPLNEQRRIVARIDVLFERIAEARGLRVATEEDAERLMPATLVEVLDIARSQHVCQTIGKLVEDGVLEIVGGGTPSKKNPAFWSGTIPWVSPKDMKHWYIDDTEDHITPQAIDKSSAKPIPAEAVLVVVRGMILARTWPVAIAGAELTEAWS